MDSIKVFLGSSNPSLGNEICSLLQLEPGRLEISRFSNDNLFVQVLESVREEDVFVIQSIYPDPNESLIELMLLCDALRSASARRITVVIPHYSYARSDKKDKPRISIAARLFADLLQAAGATRFLMMNLHADQVRGYFSVPTDHLLSQPIIVDHLKQLDLGNTVALLDFGQQKREGDYARLLSLPIAIINKERKSDTKVEIKHMIGDVKGQNVLLFEDEISRGTSLMAAVNKLKQLGAREVRAVCTHGLFCGPAIQMIQESPIAEVITTNTVAIPAEKRIDKVTVLSVAPLFADAIQRIHNGESISVLFSD